MSPSEREVWDRHWRALAGESALFGTLASLVRRLILSRAVRHYADRYFPAEGTFLETGCGTAESSARIARGGRRLVGMDLSLPALQAAHRAGNLPHLLTGDLRRLPFRDGSVAGIWNLGVMEHFEPEDGREILRELRRVLVPGGVVLLFWPPELGSSRWVLAPVERLRSRWQGRPFRFFPDEVHRLRSRRHGREFLCSAGFEPVAVGFTPRDAFIHMVAVGRKPTA